MTELGNYLIGKTIGEGTFGKVCHAKHQVLGHDVAVKILEKKRINDELDIERVKREITILQMLHHPNVVQLYEMIETDTHIYLFMEYADGGELFDYIDLKKRINEVEACKFLHEIISAIQYIHQLRIVHRDLKPENLLLTAQKKILVVDFGLSNTYEDTLKTACGSPCYAAPEMIQGKPYYGLQTDLWSCGVILYAMLCGYLPFEDNNTQVLYKKILTADFHIPRYVSLDGKDLIKNILTVDPTKRFTIEQIKQHKWWQLWKSDNIQMTPFKASFNKISCTLLPNSIYKSCVKKNIERNISEDVKTCCDTAQQSIDIQFIEKEDFINRSIIKEEIKQNPPLEKKTEELNQQFTNVADHYEFQQSMRSLTRQKSSQSIQSNTHLHTQIDSPLKQQNLAVTTKQSIPIKQQISQFSKVIPKKPPILTQQQQQSLQQKKPITKTVPSKSLHEPPNFESKLAKQPNTPSTKQQNNNATQNPTNNLSFVSHQLKTDIPKKNSIPPVKLSVIQEQLKENKEKSHSLKTQPTQTKQQQIQQQQQQQQQQQIQQQQQQQQIQQPKQQINLNKPQNLNKTPIKQNTPQINSTKRSLHQKQAASLQMERQSFHTQQSTVEENSMLQFNDNPKPIIENTKLMVEKFTSRLNNVIIPSSLKQPQKQGIQDIKGIENYYGPYNISFITTKHPQLFLKGIQKYLEEKYQLIQIQNFQNGFMFNLNELKIDLKLFRIEHLEIFYCQINCENSKNIANNQDFNTIIYDLQTNFKF